MTRRAFWKVIRNSIIAELEYRTNYIILIFSTVISLVMELAVYKQMYHGREAIGWLPKSHVFSFVLIGILLRYASQLWTLVSEAIDEIREGTFRKYLLQPLNYSIYFYAKAIGPKVTTWALSILTIVIVKFLPDFGPLLPPQTWLPFAFATVVSVTLCWQIYLAFVCLGFWIEEATFLSIAFNIGISLFSGTLMPLTWLPEAMQSFLAWTPFPLIGDFPIRAALDLLPQDEFTLYAWKSFIWIALLFVTNSSLKWAGTRRYEAYGG